MTCDLSDAGTIMDEGRQLSNQFNSLSFLHTKKEGNKVAYALAKEGLNCIEEMKWVEDWPSCLHSLVIAEAFSPIE
ncbi:hypothetical protein DITRI_Ditri05aG0097000 [Diplodiscus trichospermus]